MNRQGMHLTSILKIMLLTGLALIWMVCSTAGAAYGAEQPPDRPDRPVRPVLPERHGLRVEPEPPSGSTEGAEAVKTGQDARIELHIHQSDRPYWTEVEWMDTAGTWHVVQGWRGMADGGVVGWHVSPAHFAKGPFRWQVYPAARDSEMQPIVTSKPFQLPGESNATLIVEVDVSR